MLPSGTPRLVTYVGLTRVPVARGIELPRNTPSLDDPHLACRPCRCPQHSLRPRGVGLTTSPAGWKSRINQVAGALPSNCIAVDVPLVPTVSKKLGAIKYQ